MFEVENIDFVHDLLSAISASKNAWELNTLEDPWTFCTCLLVNAFTVLTNVVVVSSNPAHRVLATVKVKFDLHIK